MKTITLEKANELLTGFIKYNNVSTEVEKMARGMAKQTFIDNDKEWTFFWSDEKLAKIEIKLNNNIIEYWVKQEDLKCLIITDM